VKGKKRNREKKGRDYNKLAGGRLKSFHKGQFVIHSYLFIYLFKIGIFMMPIRVVSPFSRAFGASLRFLRLFNGCPK